MYKIADPRQCRELKLPLIGCRWGYFTFTVMKLRTESATMISRMVVENQDGNCATIKFLKSVWQLFVQRQGDVTSGLTYIKLFWKHVKSLWPWALRKQGAQPCMQCGAPRPWAQPQASAVEGKGAEVFQQQNKHFLRIWTLFPLLPDRDDTFVVFSAHQSPGPNFPDGTKILHMWTNLKISTSKTREVET